MCVCVYKAMGEKRESERREGKEKIKGSMVGPGDKVASWPNSRVRFY